jgi:hypothetical protein
MAVLITDVEDAQRLAAALDEVRRADAPLAVIAVPPVRGLAFFADEDRQEKLDRWWAHAIPRAAEPVSVLVHEEGVAEWLPGLDGRFIVGVAAPEQARQYRRLRNVTIAGGTGLLDLALAAIDLLDGSNTFRDDARARLEKRLRRPGSETGARFRRARLRPADEAFLGGRPTPATNHPIPNLPPHLPAVAAPTELDQDAAHDDLVRALADTLRRLQRIRSAT